MVLQRISSFVNRQFTAAYIAAVLISGSAGCSSSFDQPDGCIDSSICDLDTLCEEGLLFSSNKGNSKNDYDLFLLDFETGNVKKLVDQIFPKFGPTWSPDGLAFAYASSKKEKEEVAIKVKKFGKYQTTPITDSNHVSWQPAWSPDGSMLMFSSNRYPNFDGQNRFHIYVVPPKENQNVECLTCDIEQRDFIEPAWGPEGHMFMGYTKIPEEKGEESPGEGEETTREHKMYQLATMKIAPWERDVFWSVTDSHDWNEQNLFSDVRSPAWHKKGGLLFTGVPIEGDTHRHLYWCGYNASDHYTTCTKKNVEQLTDSVVPFDVTWSPDGTSAVFSSLKIPEDAGNPRITLFRIDNIQDSSDREVTALFPDSASNYVTPAWSPGCQK